MKITKIKALAIVLMLAGLIAVWTSAGEHHSATITELHNASTVIGNSQYVAEIPKEQSSKDSLVLVQWNAENFGGKKSSEAIATMAQILRNADIVALEEISTSNAGAQTVARLSDELNRTGSKWDYIVSDPTHESTAKERYAFLWKTSRVDARPRRATLVKKLRYDMVREPAQVVFFSGDKRFTVTSFHLAPTAKHPELEIQSLRRYADDYYSGNFIFVGDFNLGHNALDSVFENELKCRHNIEGKTSLKEKLDKKGSYYSKEYDNIFTRGNITVRKAAIIDFVPKLKDLTEARKISDHLPVFISFELN